MAFEALQSFMPLLSQGAFHQPGENQVPRQRCHRPVTFRTVERLNHVPGKAWACVVRAENATSMTVTVDGSGGFHGYSCHAHGLRM